MKMRTYDVRRKLELTYGLRDIPDGWLEHAVAKYALPNHSVADVAFMCANEWQRGRDIPATQGRSDRG